MSTKRKRNGNGITKAKRFKKGYDRVGGFYGRFGSSKLGSHTEQKFFDTTISGTIDTTAEVPTGGQLVLIPQGVTESQRVGRKAFIKSIQIRGTLNYAPGAAAAATAQNWIYLVMDTQANGAAAAVTTVLTSNNLALAMRNLANQERFKVLKIFHFSMNATAGVTTAYNGIIRTWKYYKKCNIPIEYSSTTGAITEIRSNNLFLLAGSQSGDDLTTIAAVCRVRFTD